MYVECMHIYIHMLLKNWIEFWIFKTYDVLRCVQGSLQIERNPFLTYSRSTSRRIVVGDYKHYQHLQVHYISLLCSYQDPRRSAAFLRSAFSQRQLSQHLTSAHLRSVILSHLAVAKLQRVAGVMITLCQDMSSLYPERVLSCSLSYAYLLVPGGVHCVHWWRCKRTQMTPIQSLQLRRLIIFDHSEDKRNKHGLA